MELIIKHLILILIRDVIIMYMQNNYIMYINMISTSCTTVQVIIMKL